jgi:glycosyltransferase involved in cell wall biosynthesis
VPVVQQVGGDEDSVGVPLGAGLGCLVMRFLLIHQNFPGQFRHLAPALQKAGHDVRALAVDGPGLPSIPMLRYRVSPLSQGEQTDQALRAGRLSVRRMREELAQADAAMQAMLGMQAQGFEPDFVLAHPGWGEALFVKVVWPQTRLMVYAEFFFHTQGAQVAAEPEAMSPPDPVSQAHLLLRNHIHLQAMSAAHAGWSPTRWQHSQLPSEYANKFKVIFDGVNTELLKPVQGQELRMHSGTTLRQGDEIITFINRNLEPARGFHVFMRALPRILRERPQARVVIVGGNDVSYGSAPPVQSGHQNWREYMLAELLANGDVLPRDRVHFMGKIPYPAYVRLLQLSACHVYLTTPFVLGWSCFEAMSAGALLVASATEPVQEMIAHEQNGLLVDFLDHKALATQVIDVLSHPERYAHLRLHARQRIVQGGYGLQDCLKQQLELIFS